MIDNINIFEKMLNISAYNNIGFLMDSDNVNYDQLLYDNELDSIYGSEIIDVNLSEILEDQYIETYANEFRDFFIDLRKRNDNELLDSANDDNPDNPDSIGDVLYKNDLYNMRQESIKEDKKYFLSNINHFKRFKGTKDYSMYIINFYLDLKFKHQYDIKLTKINVDSNLIVGKRYRIVETQENYFGENKKVGNIFIANNSLLVKISDGNKVSLIESLDTTYKTSGVLSISKRYKVINFDTLFTNSSEMFVHGNIITEKGYNFPSVHNNILIELQPTIITKLKETVYNIQSTLNEDVWDVLIKPLVHPVGWKVYFTNLNDVNKNSVFLQLKDIRLQDQTKLMNLGYIHNEPIVNGCDYYSLQEISNLNMLDTFKLNSNIGYKRTFIDFTLLSVNSEKTNVSPDHIFKLVFSDEVQDDFDINDIELRKQGSVTILESEYIKEDNVIIIIPNNSLDIISIYTITVNTSLENIKGVNINNTIKFKFKIKGIM